MSANDNSKRLKGHTELVLALASGQSVKGAAQKAGIAERTAHRRLEDPAVRREIQQLRATMIERATGQLATITTLAVKTLADILRSGESEQNRLAAARAVLSYAAQYVEANDMSERLARLEELLESDEPKVRRLAS